MTPAEEELKRQAGALMDEVLRRVAELGGPRYALMALLAVAGTLIALGNFDPEEAHQLLDDATASMSEPPRHN